MKRFFTERCVLCGIPLYRFFCKIHKNGDELPLCDECFSRILKLKIARKGESTGENFCRICSRPLISEKSICRGCREKTYSFTSNRSIFSYSLGGGELIRAYKFRKNRALALLFADLAAELIEDAFSETLPIVPAPPRRHVRRMQGWEHVEEISGLLEKHHGKAILRLLKRKGGKEQKSLDYAGRRDNMRGNILIKERKRRFTENSSDGISECIFLDDVFTTGATADESARVLKRYGFNTVHVITLAVD
jgi:ComF family protein